MSKNLKTIALCLGLSLLTVGILSSFASPKTLSHIADTFHPTDTGSGTGTDTGEDNGKALTTLTCTKTAFCPKGNVTTTGFSQQCVTGSGFCHSSNERGCDAPEPTCKN